MSSPESQFLQTLPTLFTTPPSVDSNGQTTNVSNIGGMLNPIPNPDPNSSAAIPTITAPILGLMATVGFSLQTVSNFFTTLDTGTPQTSHADFLQLISDLITSSGGTPPADITTTFAYQEFYNTFLYLLGIPPTIGYLQVGNLTLNPNLPTPDPANLGDLAALIGDTSSTSTTPSTAAFTQQLFLKSMNNFLVNYVFKPSATAQQFVNDWLTYMTAITSISTDKINNSTTQNLVSYQDLYFAFVPGATQAGFQANVTAFVNSVTASNGYFLPSQFLNQWFAKVQTLSETGTSPGISSVTGTDSANTNIIFIILKLLNSMISTLQNVAAAQGNRLTFYANVQKAYTDLLGKIPTININNIKPFVNDSATNINALATTVSSTNQAYTEKLQSYQAIFQDNAKQQQTVINQSNEAVNQQADLATSLLQEMSTILQGIFK